jgi:hypothetical protein
MRWNAPLYDSLPIRLRGGFDRVVPQGGDPRFPRAFPKGYNASIAAKFPAKPLPLVPFTPSVTMPEPMAGAPDQQNTLQSLGGAVSRGRRRRGLSIGSVGTFG